MVTRIRVEEAETPTGERKRQWFGTCEKWLQDFDFPVVVVREPVRVVNPQWRTCYRCGGQHVDVPNPYFDYA